MIKLSNGMLLYHASYIAVPEIDLSYCNDGLDFGRGFYVTSSPEQAISFVPGSVRRNIRMGKIPEDFDVNDGQVSVYRYHENPALLSTIFQNADAEWVHYIAANRNHTLFREMYNALTGHDIIGGKIADDNTARTLNNYVTGLFGTPGNEIVDNFVIQALLPNRLENQFCFRTTAAIKTLEFVRSDRYGDIKK